MNPGKMDRRIVIQKRHLTMDDAGGRVITWRDESRVWAEIARSSGNESDIADADRPTNTRQFRIRYRKNVSPGTHRVLYQLKFYDITSIAEEGRQNRLLITATATDSIS